MSVAWQFLLGRRSLLFPARFLWRLFAHSVFERSDFVAQPGSGFVVFLFDCVSLFVAQLDELSLFLSSYKGTSRAFAFVFDVFVNVLQKWQKFRHKLRIVL